MTLYSVAGLDKQIDLPVPLVINLLPMSQFHRPGTPRQTPGYWVQHETGNPNAGADAAMHDRYLHSVGPVYVSWHFTVDDGVIYQHVPINEVTYQAADGAGPGNMSGVSCELCINADINKGLARRNAEALAGGIMKALGLTIDRCKRHYDFNEGTPDRHHCPDQMMNEGYWPQFVANVGVILNAGVTEQETTYPAPVGIPNMTAGDPVLVKDVWWFPVSVQVEATKKAVPRTYASTTAPQAAPTLAVKAKAKVIAYVKTDVAWLILADHSRVLAASFSPAISMKVR